MSTWSLGWTGIASPRPAWSTRTAGVPLEDDHVWLVEQFRRPVGRRFWEFPQGAWEDEPGAAPEDLARGEFARGELADAASVAAWHRVTR
jgi:8-oxo-dGTP pyrophosphatase MutT (NUDIX family)